MELNLIPREFSYYMYFIQFCDFRTLPHGDDEARARADKIASEIERNEESKRCAMLENDDEERDLDKKTQFTTHVATNWRDKSSAVKTVNTYGR